MPARAGLSVVVIVLAASAGGCCINPGPVPGTKDEVVLSCSQMFRRISNDFQVSPAEANRLWARLDRELVDRAAWLPLVTPKTTDFVSKRVGNYQYHPLWGVLLDQLWVK